MQILDTKLNILHSFEEMLVTPLQTLLDIKNIPVFFYGHFFKLTVTCNCKQTSKC